MDYDYTYKKPLEELRYYYITNNESPYSDWALAKVMQPAFKALRKEYGIRFHALEFGALPPAVQPEELVYIIYGPTNPLQMKRREREYLAALSGMGCRTNIISAYPLTKRGQDRANYVFAKTVVPGLCHELNINAIFPDDMNTAVGIRTIDWEDLRDNVIGETIRVKYRPTRTEHPEDHDLLQRLHAEHDNDIRKLAKLHAKYHLWQRAVTDGSILFTHDGYWYSSQTKTDKTKMTANDYSLITSYDEGHRAVTYAGRKLPSSDVPEHLLLSSLLSMHGERPKLIVHFHHYDLTRGDRYRELVTHKKLEYGQFASGRHLLKDIKHKMSMWLVMREHGLIWTGNTLDDFEAFLHLIGAPTYAK